MPVCVCLSAFLYVGEWESDACEAWMAIVKVCEQEIRTCVSVYICVCVCVCLRFCCVRVRVCGVRNMIGDRWSSLAGGLCVCVCLSLCLCLSVFLSVCVFGTCVSESPWRAKHVWWQLKFVSRRYLCVSHSVSVPVFVFLYSCEWESVARKTLKGCEQIVWPDTPRWWHLKFVSRSCVCVFRYLCVRLSLFLHVCVWEYVAREIWLAGVSGLEQELCMCVSVFVCVFVFISLCVWVRMCGTRNLIGWRFRSWAGGLCVSLCLCVAVSVCWGWTGWPLKFGSKSNMCVCAFVCLCVWLRVFVYLYMYVCVHMCMCVFMCVCVWVCVCLSVSVLVSLSVCVSMSVSVSLPVSMSMPLSLYVRLY